MANAATKPPSSRQLARRLAVQTLYASFISGNTVEEEAAHILALEVEQAGYDDAYFHAILAGMQDLEVLDQAMLPFLSRPLEQITPIELAILRLSMWELQQRLEIPFRVVINEGIELCKLFGAQESHKFVNGILDKAAKVFRERR